MTSGIYVIYGPGNRAYIGQSRNVSARWAWHVKDLTLRKHCNPHLQNAWIAHGARAFRFEFIVPCAKSNLIRMERAYIKAYIKAGWLLYNVLKTRRPKQRCPSHSLITGRQHRNKSLRAFRRTALR